MSTLIAASARSAEPFAQLSALDQRLVALSEEHARHAAGPIVPCPLCFEPSLGVPPARTIAGPLAEPISIAETKRRAAAA